MVFDFGAHKAELDELIDDELSMLAPRQWLRIRGGPPRAKLKLLSTAASQDRRSELVQ